MYLESGGLDHGPCLVEGQDMTNRLDTIATRQRRTRLRDRVFVAAVALVTSLTIGGVAIGATNLPAAQSTHAVAR
jgi:hypothetical protein